MRPLQTGRIPNRSGMTTVAFQGQGGGLPAAEWTLGSVLKQAGYQTYFTGKWHLGEADYALPNAQGYDEMKYTFLYHLNAYTYPDPNWFPGMDPQLREMFAKVTRGSLSGKAGEPPKEDWKVNGEYVDTPDQGVVGIPFLDAYVEKAGIEFLEQAAQSDTPWFINVNFMKMHQPNLPHPDFEHKSLSKTKYADSMVELDTHVGNLLKKLDELGLSDNTVVFFTTDNGAWQDVYPDAGYTPFRGTKGTVREGGNRVPAFVRWPGQGRAALQERRHPGRPRPDGDLRVARRRRAAEAGSRGQADHLRQLRHVAGLARRRRVRAQELVLLHRGRAVAGRRPGRALQVRVQPARR